MTIGKSNRMNALLKEVEDIEYNYLDKKVGLDPLHRRFYKHRKSLIENLITNYLNSNTNET